METCIDEDRRTNYSKTFVLEEMTSFIYGDVRLKDSEKSATNKLNKRQDRKEDGQ